MADSDIGCFAMFIYIVCAVASLITAVVFLIYGSTVPAALGVLLMGLGISVVVFFATLGILAIISR